MNIARKDNASGSFDPAVKAAFGKAGRDGNGDGATTAAQHVSGIEQLLTTWYRARNGKGLVEHARMTPRTVGEIWPRCFVIDHQDSINPLVFSQIGRLPCHSEVDGDAARNGAMLLEWITDLARKAFVDGGPLVRHDFFPCEADGTEYGCVVLPLTDRLGVIRSVIGLVERSVHKKGGSVRDPK